jgi:hypothetical protein
MSPFLADRKRLTVIDTVGDDHRTLTRIVVPTVSRRSAKGGGRTVFVDDASTEAGVP